MSQKSKIEKDFYDDYMDKYSKKLGKKEAHKRATSLIETIRRITDDLNSGRIKIDKM